MDTQTITIKINNDNALRLLEDLERLHFIEFINKATIKEAGKKLSERLSGCISHDEAKIMHQQLNEMRNEWERDI